SGAAGPQLCAYVVRSSETAVNGAELRSLARARLPEYMVPSSYLFLAELPVTASGKVDKRSLPPPAEAEETASGVPPDTTEELAAPIAAELLGVTSIG